MNNSTFNLSPPTATGQLGVLHLKRFWEKCQLKKEGRASPESWQEEWNMDFALLSVLGLGLEQTIKYVYLADNGFEAFENWILELNDGKLIEENIDAFNQSVISGLSNSTHTSNSEMILTRDDMDFWKENGYVIIREAITKSDCEATIDVICDFISIKKDDPSTWYAAHQGKQGIMVQLFQHPLLEKNRKSEKIKKAYKQLWGRNDIWVNTDRVGFNPPETATWKFPGPGMHWDVSLQLPIPFGLQGILYLNDTAANQGAFTLVPGFQHKMEGWLKNLPPSINPRNENIHALGSQAVVANAGDFIIWHHALPHGSSPNTSALPRFVQYINYAPFDTEVSEKWI
jgi:hypothetical protein